MIQLIFYIDVIVFVGQYYIYYSTPWDTVYQMCQSGIDPH